MDSKLVAEISRITDWRGKEVCKLMMDVLTNCNFHTLRKKIVPIINKELQCRIRLEG